MSRPPPPTGENGELAAVSAVSGPDAWAVGSTNAELNGVGAKALIDSWNGTARTQVATPTTPGNTAYLTAVSASSTTDAWAVGRTQENRQDFAPLGLHWNGTQWTQVASPDDSSPSLLLSASTNPGASIVWAVGFSGSCCTENPLVLQNG